MLLRTVNHLRTTIAIFAFEQACYHKFGLQNLLYHDLRPAYPGLASNHFIRAFASVAVAYKTERQKREIRAPLTFDDRSAIDLDRDLWGFKPDRTVSVTCGIGRFSLRYHCGAHQDHRLRYATQSAKLLYRRGQFYLQVVCDVPEKEPADVEDYVGVDLGIVNVAVDSDGQVHNAAIEAKRQKYQKHRSSLQKRGTKSAKRRLKKVAGQQARFQKDVNHVISKRLVAKAKGTQRGIALEDLTGIRHRTEQRLRKSQRAKHANWSFFQLRSFVKYKTRLRGVPVVLVDPAYTSQTCSNPACGHVSPANRKNQSVFRCVNCGLTLNADLNAALNIARTAHPPRGASTSLL